MVQLYSLWGNPPIKYSDYLKKKGSVYTMDIIEKITASQIKKDLPEFRVGDSVIVGCIITETKGGKSKERVQDFKGTVIARKGKGVSETFTVRGEYSGIGVEKLSMYILIRLLILRLLNQVKLEELNYIS